MELLVAVFAGIMGAAMGGVWTRDILNGVGFDASGGLLHRFGWFGVNLTALPFLGATAIALIMLNARRPSVVRGS